MSAGDLIEVGRIVAPPRPVFRDPARVDELSSSIRVVGLRCPLVVRPIGLGTFELVDGFLRHQAVDELGWSEVRAVVLELDDRAAARLRLTLNSARRTMSALEEARLVRFLLDRGDHPSTIAAVLGRPTSWVQARLELLDRLCATLLLEVERGALSPRLAGEIAAAPRAGRRACARPRASTRSRPTRPAASRATSPHPTARGRSASTRSRIPPPSWHDRAGRRPLRRPRRSPTSSRTCRRSRST